jgi:hypothetical protein
MRKIIIKYWFGIYDLKIKSKSYRPERAAITNFILSLIMIAVFLFANENVSKYIVPILFFIIVFGTFLYFKIKPVKWQDLNTDIQKWYYGYFYFVKYKDKIPVPKEINKTEWKKLNKIYSK